MNKKECDLSAQKCTLKQKWKNKKNIIFILLTLIFVLSAFGICNINSVKYTIIDKINCIFPNFMPYCVYYENNVPHYDIREVDFEKNDYSNRTSYRRSF